MRWINEIVDGILDTYKTNSPYELCKYFNINIEKVDQTSSILYKNDSVYYRNYYNSEIIFIKNDLYGYDEEFKLRHELGHAILHTDICNSRYMNIGKLERQANYFALALTGIKFDLVEMEGMTLQQIASSLRVPFEPLSQLVNL
ncbi:MAG: ImmA/IrrE family metallo-endopeptidase [Bacilli bacterium]